MSQRRECQFSAIWNHFIRDLMEPEVWRSHPARVPRNGRVRDGMQGSKSDLSGFGAEMLGGGPLERLSLRR